MKIKPIKLDGSAGGGQILRSALSLSLVTGKPFHLTSIRGKRPKPGLMRQHLTCVLAAAEVSGGSVDGAVLGSKSIVFHPGKVTSGDYHFAIGTAGSITLLAQTLMPAFWATSTSATLALEGGTHNPMAPPVEFLQRAYLPCVQRIGFNAEIELVRPGFAPAGGGELRITVPESGELNRLEIQKRGAEISHQVECVVAHVKDSIARREIGEALNALGWDEDCAEVVDMSTSSAPGNLLAAELVFENVTERVSSFGQFGKRAKQVAREVSKGIRDYLSSGAVVGRRLGDQLLLPMALAKGGSFNTMTASNHLQTNAAVIQQFCAVEIQLEDLEAGGCQVSIR